MLILILLKINRQWKLNQLDQQALQYEYMCVYYLPTMLVTVCCVFFNMNLIFKKCYNQIHYKIKFITLISKIFIRDSLASLSVINEKDKCQMDKINIYWCKNKIPHTTEKKMLVSKYFYSPLWGIRSIFKAMYVNHKQRYLKRVKEFFGVRPRPKVSKD